MLSYFFPSSLNHHSSTDRNALQPQSSHRLSTISFQNHDDIHYGINNYHQNGLMNLLNRLHRSSSTYLTASADSTATTRGTPAPLLPAKKRASTFEPTLHLQPQPQPLPNSSERTTSASTASHVHASPSSRSWGLDRRITFALFARPPPPPD